MTRPDHSHDDFTREEVERAYRALVTFDVPYVDYLAYHEDDDHPAVEGIEEANKIASRVAVPCYPGNAVAYIEDLILWHASGKHPSAEPKEPSDYAPDPHPNV